MHRRVEIRTRKHRMHAFLRILQPFAYTLGIFQFLVLQRKPKPRAGGGTEPAVHAGSQYPQCVKGCRIHDIPMLLIAFVMVFFRPFPFVWKHHIADFLPLPFPCPPFLFQFMKTPQYVPDAISFFFHGSSFPLTRRARSFFGCLRDLSNPNRS